MFNTWKRYSLKKRLSIDKINMKLSKLNIFISAIWLSFKKFFL